jgi:hypothetical protein
MDVMDSDVPDAKWECWMHSRGVGISVVGNRRHLLWERGGMYPMVSDTDRRKLLNTVVVILLG